MSLSGNEENKGSFEVRVFKEFIEKANINIDKKTIEKRLPPEPDILCKDWEGNYIAFELAELCSQELAHSQAKEAKLDDNSVFIDTARNVKKIVMNKDKKSFNYKTKYPIEILYYTNGRIHQNEDVITSSINTGYSKYRRVWFLGREGVKLVSSII